MPAVSLASPQGERASAPAGAEHVDPASAPAADVAADLRRLDEAVAASRVAVADAHAVLVDAGDRLDDAEERAEAERHAHEQRVAERARQVVPPANGVVRLLGDTRPDEVDDAGAAVAEAEDASDEAIADRDAAEADLAAFLDATVARTTAQLAHADRVAVTDPASADAIRADESTVFAPVAEVVTNQQ